MEFSKQDKVIDLVICKLKFGEFMMINSSVLKDDFNFENERELDNIFKLAEAEDLLDRKGKRTWMYLTKKGFEIQKNGGWLLHLENEKIKAEKAESKDVLEIENLKLQKENSEYTKTLRQKEAEIRNLTRDNLRLNNWDIRFRWIIALITFLIGFITKYFIDK
ncbi:MAG TPA: hypothetical protein PLP39_07225 [Flavobacterium lutivivi]|nr:hypothetical protein [Flavobacterium lutivivi]